MMDRLGVVELVGWSSSRDGHQTLPTLSVAGL